MVASNTTIANEATPSSDRTNDQRHCTDPEETAATNKQQNQDAKTSTTPLSSSSTRSTTSSGKPTTISTSSHGSTHTMGKFKEKPRPEPLNLNPNLNQEIPLDLSVKSAGNMPSGRSMNTLETPRIFWVDNEALLIKPRLYSSSTNASQKIKLSSLAGDSPPITPNTPFMDLVSPTARSADYHPHSATMLIESNSSLHSLLSAHYQYNRQQQQNFDDNLLVTANKHTPTNKFYPIKGNNELIKTPRRCCSTDNLSALGTNAQLQSFRTLNTSYRSQQQRLLPQQNSNEGKKNSVSPLVTKNLSSSNGSCNRFSYSGQQIANCNWNTTSSDSCNVKDKLNSAINVTGDQSQSSDYNTTSNTGKALTPTSVASATSNLLNIHLNSPTSQGPTLMESFAQQPIGSISSIKDLLATNTSPSTEYRSTDQNMDPLISAAYCQHHQQNNILRSSLTSPSSSFGGSDNQDKQHHNIVPTYGHQSNLSGILTNGFTSLGSSTTLNTPTLISPSQLKSGSSICFLPSPTLSPMSSVFDLPSPLLMFPPPYSSNLTSVSQVDQTNKSNKVSSVPKEASIPHEKVQLQTVDSIGSSENDQTMTKLEVEKRGNILCNSESTNNESNMGLLVTSARDKLDVSAMEEEVTMDDMKMDIESQDILPESTDLVGDESRIDDKLIARDNSQNQQARPATVIPKILVSDVRPQLTAHAQYQDIQQRENQKPTYQDNNYAQQHQDSGTFVAAPNEAQFRNQRDIVGKRALSPQSFRNKVSVYHNERSESSSAPPDVYHSRARSKIKCATVGIENQQRHSDQQYAHPQVVHHLQSSPTQMNYHNQHYKTNVPYPDLQSRWLPVDEQQQSLSIKTGCLTSGRPYSGVRPNSAEPCSSRYCQPRHRGELQYHVDNPATTHHQQQHHHHHHQQQQQQQISSLGNSFSQSEQHLRSDWMDVKPSMSGQMAQHQCQSASADELNRFQMNCGSFVGLTTNQLATAAIQQHHNNQHEQSHMQFVRNSMASYPLTAHNNNLQSPIVKLDDMIHQSPIPIQVEQDFSSNQLTQGHEAQYQECETMLSAGQPRPLPQPRALSADIKSMSRSESSCSSVDFCFRSSSAASGTTAKKYHCDDCRKAFTRSDMLTRHKRLHSKERPFQCNECKQEFSRSDHLSTHMRTHTGEKPYKCKLCSYSACRKDMITRHMKVHNRASPNVQPMERG